MAWKLVAGLDAIYGRIESFWWHVVLFVMVDSVGTFLFGSANTTSARSASTPRPR
jgi:hypothetical protein